MKKRALALLLTLALLLPLAACGEESRARPSSSAPEPSSHLIQSQPPADTSVPQADDALVRQVVTLYGAREDDTMDGAGKLRPQTISLYYRSESWSQPDQLEPGSYFSWFFASTFLLDGDYEVMNELYKNPMGEDHGWFFPQDLYEERIQKYFEIDVEHLRSDPLYYHREYQGYCVDGGGGKGEAPEITYTYEQDGDLLTIPVTLHYQLSPAAVCHTLTVRLEPGGGWKYLGCQVGKK